MTENIYQGDPKFILSQNGSRFLYIDGQPIMDQGIENTISIKLGTKTKGKESHQKGWIGNFLIEDLEKRYGTDYQNTFENQPINLTGLTIREEATKKALKSRLFGEIESTVTNPNSDKTINKIVVRAPAGIFEFKTEISSQLWRFQDAQPAGKKIEEQQKPIALIYNLVDSGDYLIVDSEGYIIQSYEGVK